MEEIKSSYPGIQKLIDSYNEPVYIVNCINGGDIINPKYTKPKSRISTNRKSAEKIYLEEANLMLKDINLRFNINLWIAEHLGLSDVHDLKLPSAPASPENKNCRFRDCCYLNHKVFEYMEIIEDKEFDTSYSIGIFSGKPKQYSKIKDNCPYEFTKQIIDKLVPWVILDLQEVSFE